MSEQKPSQRSAGIASPTRGPHALTPEHMKKTDGQLPAHVPPPDAELHPTKDAPERPR
ncbi:MAG TPA: hypothetical protein VN823_28515 [Stellaceae bacterium]|nr:hypothetical protein [Stellaceae bacterium]